MKVQILRHDCSIGKMLQILKNPNAKPTGCPFHFMMWGAHCFNLLGIRVIIGEFK
jgi:hypothetical protein